MRNWTSMCTIFVDIDQITLVGEREPINMQYVTWTFAAWI